MSTVPLQKLRSNITVIPYECTICKETLKFNLDPAGRATDLEMTDILKKMGLAHLLEKENHREREN